MLRGIKYVDNIVQLSSLSASGTFFFFVFSRATPMAYGGSQARGPIGAVAASLHHSHSNAGSEPHLQPTPQVTQLGILNPVNEARD